MNMNILIKQISINLLVFTFFTASLFAAEIQAPYSGSGTVNITQSNSPGSYNASLTWNISQAQGGMFTYIYTLKGGFVIRNGRDPPYVAGIDNIALQTGASIVASQILNSNYSFAGPQSITSSLTGFKNIPSSIFGIDFTGVIGTTNAGGVETVTLQFNSYQAPIWGNLFYSGKVTGGQAVTCPPNVDCTKYAFAYNSNFNTAPTSGLSSYASWVPVPGSITVPEPSMYLLLASALAGVFFFNYFRTKKTKTI